MWDIIWYTENEGTSPVQEYMLRLDPVIQTKFVASTTLVKRSSITGQSVAEYLERQLWEIREERDIHRLIFSYLAGQRIVLLHGFLQQNRQVTPLSEIEEALRRLNQWE